MILPDDRYRFNGRKSRSSRLWLWILIIIALGGGIGTGLWYYLVNRNEAPPLIRSEAPEEAPDSPAGIEELWNEQKYQQINDQCEIILTDNPADYRALVYNGFSYFYRGVAQFALEDQLPLFNAALKNLRKALTIDRDDLKPEIKYVLGKTYYQKGEFYSDLAIRYLEEALEEGYNTPDLFEYLGLANNRMGRKEESVSYYLKAIEGNPTDMLFLVTARTYYEMAEYTLAEDYLNRTIARTEDHALEAKSRYLLGKIYTEQGDYSKAEKEYKMILEKNDKAADAYYYLGELYEILGDSAKARYEWRRALEINPSHYGAYLKLND